MTNPERAYVKKRTIDNTPLSPDEQAFYNWYITNNREDRARSNELVDMDAFEDIYSDAKIQKDKNWVIEQRQKTNQADHSERAEIAEYIIKTFANDSEWFGAHSAVSETSEYDDRKHHTDFVVEWDDDNGEIECALAIDVTVSADNAKISEKLFDITKEIRSGSLTNIEYHLSQLTGDPSSLSMIPRAVIIFDKDQLPALCKKLLTHTKEKAIMYDQEKQHFMQIYLLKLVQAQLSKQLEYISGLTAISGNSKKLHFAKNNIKKTLDHISAEVAHKEKGLPDTEIRQAYQTFNIAHQRLASM